MITLLSPNFVPIPFTKGDLAISSLAFGWTLGFGWLTTWTAIQQTSKIRKRNGLTSTQCPYVVMIWGEIVVCLVFAIISWLHILEVIPPSFSFFFCILTTWALQVQFLLQIIVNRISILLPGSRKALHLKIGVAVLITAINISVYCIWIPARLQISPTYTRINDIWDRIEKSIYLVVDAALNWYFMRTVHSKLVANGLAKYKKLIQFNMLLVAFSLCMDCLIIGMMSLQNNIVYLQFHPLAYMVKLNIEMTMAELIATVSTSRHNPSNSEYQEKHVPLRISVKHDISIKHDYIGKYKSNTSSMTACSMEKGDTIKSSFSNSTVNQSWSRF